MVSQACLRFLLEQRLAWQFDTGIRGALQASHLDKYVKCWLGGFCIPLLKAI